MRGCTLEVNPEGLGWQSTLCLFNFFFKPGLEVEIFFEKERTTKQGGVDFKIEIKGLPWGTCR